MSGVTLPPPREPAIDPRTNTFSRNWILYFQQLFERVGGSIADLINLADFIGVNQSLQPDGHQRLPGGLVWQWGTSSTDSTGQVSITFPRPFKTACVAIKCEETNASGPSGITFSHSAPTLDGVVIYGSGAGTDNAAKPFNWQAIGY